MTYVQGKIRQSSLQADEAFVTWNMKSLAKPSKNNRASLKEHWGYFEEAGTDFDHVVKPLVS